MTNTPSKTLLERIKPLIYTSVLASILATTGCASIQYSGQPKGMSMQGAEAQMRENSLMGRDAEEGITYDLFQYK